MRSTRSLRAVVHVRCCSVCRVFAVGALLHATCVWRQLPTRVPRPEVHLDRKMIGWPGSSQQSEMQVFLAAVLAALEAVLFIVPTLWFLAGTVPFLPVDLHSYAYIYALPHMLSVVTTIFLTCATSMRARNLLFVIRLGVTIVAVTAFVFLVIGSYQCSVPPGLDSAFCAIVRPSLYFQTGLIGFLVLVSLGILFIEWELNSLLRQIPYPSSPSESGGNFGSKRRTTVWMQHHRANNHL